MVQGLRCFGPVVGQLIMVGDTVDRLLTSGSGRQKREQEGAGPGIPFKVTRPLTSLPSARPQLLKGPPPPKGATGW